MVEGDQSLSMCMEGFATRNLLRDFLGVDVVLLNHKIDGFGFENDEKDQIDNAVEGEFALDIVDMVEQLLVALETDCRVVLDIGFEEHGT